MQTAIATRVAFKEWAVTVHALAAGQQLVLVRKGGIREEGHTFRVEEPRFLLYPTYEHQRADLLQPAYRPNLDAVVAVAPPADRVRIDHWAEVVDVCQTRDATDVAALAPHFLWTQAYAQERLRWRPKQPLYVLLLRVFRLAEAHTLPLLPAYLGCKSWVELDTPVSLEGMTPVLAEAEFAARRAAVRAALGH